MKRIKGEIITINQNYHREDMVGLTGEVYEDQVGGWVSIIPLKNWQEKGYKGIFSIPENCLD